MFSFKNDDASGIQLFFCFSDVDTAVLLLLLLLHLKSIDCGGFLMITLLFSG